MRVISTRPKSILRISANRKEQIKQHQKRVKIIDQYYNLSYFKIFFLDINRTFYYYYYRIKLKIRKGVY